MEVRLDMNLEHILARLAALGGPEVDAKIAEAINKVLYEGQILIQTDTPVRTGALRDSIQVTEAQNEPNPTGWIGTSVYYALYIEYGTSRGVRPYAMFRRNFPTIHMRAKEEITKALQELL